MGPVRQGDVAMAHTPDTGEPTPNGTGAERLPTGAGLKAATASCDNESWPAGEPKAWFDRLLCNVTPPQRRQ